MRRLNPAALRSCIERSPNLRRGLPHKVQLHGVGVSNGLGALMRVSSQVAAPMAAVEVFHPWRDDGGERQASVWVGVDEGADQVRWGQPAPTRGRVLAE